MNRNNFVAEINESFDAMKKQEYCRKYESKEEKEKKNENLNKLQNVRFAD